MNAVYNKYHGVPPREAVYIGRGSPYGNPFVIGKDGTRNEVIAKYRDYLLSNPDLLSMVKSNLRGEDLVCFCAPRPCHGDILLEIANQ